MAKSFATEAAVRITLHAVQVHRPFGISREGQVERDYRSARILTIPDRTTQIDQLIIGRNLLGLDACGEVKGPPVTSPVRAEGRCRSPAVNGGG